MRDWITPITQAQEELDFAKEALNGGKIKAFAGRVQDACLVLNGLLDEINEEIVEENPYLLTGEELKQTETARKKGMKH